MVSRRVTFRLYPSCQEEKLLQWTRAMHKHLYNAAVHNRKTQYQKFGHKIDYFEQQRSLPEFKKQWTEYQKLNAGSLQATLKRVDFAFNRFFQRLAKYPRFKSIRHYPGWTYPDSRQGFKIHSSGINGYLELTDLKLKLQMRGKSRLWGKPTTCTLFYRNGKWFASITLEVSQAVLRTSGTGAVGIDIGCQSALAITDGENHQIIDAPRFLRKAEKLIKKVSKEKRRKRAANRNKKIKASRRWKKAQKKVSKLCTKVANQRQDWVHQVTTQIVSSNSLVVTEKLEVKKMTRKSKKRRKQKAGLNKSILDVGFGMLNAAMKYKVQEAGGIFLEAPTRTLKPSQTCPKCGNQEKKTLDIRQHICSQCGYSQDRDVAAAEVVLLWAKGILPESGIGFVDVDGSSSTSGTSKRKNTGSMKQLTQKKRQKQLAVNDIKRLEGAETSSSVADGLR